MNRGDPVAAVEAVLDGRARRGAPLAPFSSFKVGGPADLLVEPETDTEVEAVIRAASAAGLPLFTLGGGTNLLIRDGGIRGVVMRLGKSFRSVETEDTRLIAGAMAPMSRVAQAAERAGLAGLEFGYDIPGTVGGALRMNAGAHGGEIRQILIEVGGVDAAGRPVRIPADQVRFAYRTAVYPVEAVFLRAVFALRAGDRQELAARRREYHDYRLRTQPKGHSVGSVFVNPEGDHAGRLIEAAGLKGARVGGAVVSAKHANWILNENRATAADIEALIRRVQAVVKDTFGVELRTEVRVVGEPASLEAAR
jgi:UDP-N-acetylmuramate dehydrogenase